MLKDQQADILKQWLQKLEHADSRIAQALTQEERLDCSRKVLTPLLEALDTGVTDAADPRFDGVRKALEGLSASFAERGLTPTETATYVFSLKDVLFDVYRHANSPQDAADQAWQINLLIDQLGLYTFESYSMARERIIKSQSQSLADLSTPVIQMWQGIIALPLVGNIDSNRAKEIMEKLLEAVVAQQADIVVIDITGVPVVDTQVANRLMRTVEAVRLLGTRSIITGINPIIAQTLVQLGVDLSQLTTKASLRAGLEQAFRLLRLRVVPIEAGK